MGRLKEVKIKFSKCNESPSENVIDRVNKRHLSNRSNDEENEKLFSFKKNRNKIFFLPFTLHFEVRTTFGLLMFFRNFFSSKISLCQLCRKTQQNF